MLKKVIYIENVGKFAACKPVGDVYFRGLTLVFGENGRGKTTLCGILRSVATGDASYISERHRLGEEAEPKAELLTDSGVSMFKGNAWDNCLPGLTVFDSCYVHENVYAGDFIAHEHKKNLHRVIVGKQGVELNRKISKLDSESREVAREVRSAAAELTKEIPNGISLDSFLKLPENLNAVKELSELESEMVALKRSNDISDTPPFDPIQVPTLPNNYESLLKQQLPEISADAESEVRNHLATNTEEATQPWAEEGLSYIKEERCPFCGADILANKIIEAYRGFFSEAYAKFKGDISSTKTAIGKALSDLAIESIGTKLDSNDQRVKFWSQFVDLKENPTLPGDCDWREALLSLRGVATRYSEEKLKSPLDSVALGTDYTAAHAAVEQVREIVEAYNGKVRIANQAIQLKKQETCVSDLKQKQQQARVLSATIARYKPAVIAKCSEYASLLSRKEAVEAEKNDAKNKLDSYSASVFSTHCDRINELLEEFRASFRLADLRSQYPGGKPSSTFEILIRNERVSVGDPAEPRGKPRFGCTLSSGDKSTLALAFFLAHLEQDPNKSNTVVVFDDPFTSQDRFRRTRTEQLITKTHKECKQVIVFSHDPLFLKLVYDNHQKAKVKTLQVAREGRDNATIAEWDIEKATQPNYTRDYLDLHAYIDHSNGEPRSIARKIRPVLEGILRMRFPNEFPDGEWLGDFIQKIRRAEPNTPLSTMQPVLLGQLESLNDYSKKYHHNTSPATADVEEISDAELVDFCEATVRFVGGY